MSLPVRSRSQSRLTTCRLLFCAVLLLYTSVYAEIASSHTKQTLDSMRAVAENFVRNGVYRELGIEQPATHTTELQVTVNQVDQRLLLPLCPAELQAFALNSAPLAARNTVGVRCSSRVEWTVYLQVQVDSIIDVLVLRHPVSRDAQLLASDVDKQRRRVPGFGNLYITDVVKLADYRVKRAAPAGMVVTLDLMRRDAVIHRGQQVTLVTSLAGIDVRANGIALADAGSASRIRVQNTSSLKIVEGTVETANTVRVGL